MAESTDSAFLIPVKFKKGTNIPFLIFLSIFFFDVHVRRAPESECGSLLYTVPHPL